jgi:uncharacterized Zn finger protein
MLTRDNLKEYLTSVNLRRLAGAKAFKLGMDYFDSGQVVSLEQRDGKLFATVQGTDKYLVTLCLDGGVLAFECTCPMGVEDAFCRHCVAAGLAWLAEGTDSARTKESLPPSATLEDARRWLAKQSKTKLVKMILERAAADPRLRDRLARDAASQD